MGIFDPLHSLKSYNMPVGMLAGGIAYTPQIPMQAQSPHIEPLDLFTPIKEILQSIASAFQRAITNIAKILKPFFDALKQYPWREQRKPRPHRHSMQTKAFLRIVNGSKKHNEIHAKRRRRSARRIFDYQEG